MGQIVPDDGLDWLLGQWPRAASVQAGSSYIGLFTSQTASAVVARTATMAACIVEPAGGSYARQVIASSAWGAPATSGLGRKSAGPQITFPTATGNWGVVNGFFLTASAAGNTVLIYQANFDDLTGVTINTNDIIKVTPSFQLSAS